MATYRSNKPPRLFQQPVAKAVLLFGILFVLFLQYCRVNSYRDPGSAFFDPERAYVQWYTAYRYDEASNFTANIALSAALDAGKKDLRSRYIKQGPDPKICATFITVKRDISQQYIDFSIGSMLEGITASERADMHLKVFFPQLDPTTHPTWREPWLRDLVDDAYSYSESMSQADLDRVTSLTNQQNFVEKAILDYITALGHCYTTTKSPYVAIFEDDVIFADTWLVRSLQALQKVEKQSKRWLYMRLFNQERSTGWKINVPFIVLVSAMATYALLTTARRSFFVVRRRVDNATLIFLTLIVAPAFVTLFFKAGKATMMPPSPGVRREAFGCCSQGLIFPREHLPGLMEYLRAVEIHKTDLLINSYSRIAQFDRFSLYPVMMQHIGIKTSQPTKEISASEPRAVWSMAFEELDPDKLRKEHAQMVTALYGKNALEKSMFDV